MPYHPVGTLAELHRRARLPLGRPGFGPDFARSDFGAGFASPFDKGGFELFFEFCPAFAAGSATCARSPATTAAARNHGVALRQLPQSHVQHDRPPPGYTPASPTSCAPTADSFSGRRARSDAGPR